MSEQIVFEPAPGELGATKQSWHSTSARGLLRRLMEQNAGDNESELLNAFYEEILKPANHGLLLNALEYWFTNNYRSLVAAASPEERAEKARRRQDDAQNIRARVERKIEEKARLILLDLVLPNGKKLRDTTGQECLDMAKHVGLWLSAVAARVPSGEKVGSVLSEAEVVALYSGPVG